MPKIKIGYRIIKTAIAVFFCVIISHFISRDTPVLSCLAAVYTMRTNVSTTFAFGKHRFAGTFIGVLVSLGVIFIQRYIGRSPLIDATSAAIGVVLIIVLCLHFKHPEGIITGTSTLLIICFNTLHTETYSYAILRLFDVVIGATVAVAVDYVLPSKKIEVPQK